MKKLNFKKFLKENGVNIKKFKSRVKADSDFDGDFCQLFKGHHPFSWLRQSFEWDLYGVHSKYGSLDAEWWNLCSKKENSSKDAWNLSEDALHGSTNNIVSGFKKCYKA